MRLWCRVLFCFAALGAGCMSRSGSDTVPSAAPAEAEPVPERFAGYYEAGWEREVFQPCGRGEEWWSWSTARIITDDSRGWGRAFVVLEGTVSPRGRFGHLGRYPRQITITRVLEVRPADAGACGSLVQRG